MLKHLKDIVVCLMNQKKQYKRHLAQLIKWRSYDYISEDCKSNISFLPYRLYSCLT